MVGARDGLVVCSVYVASCAEILDADTSLAPPDGGWQGRWSGKRL